ncbi:uncharacterized protein LOC133821021 [Humulus lupulus]|uniref:uncharacterized protein LOC133821021 n=1 Tax=Humulus lupulus TaxID=3486 RepID=UPI002B402072|nr:uncharacterized protein LOC133821021 [Humulus lupulus]
MDPLPEVNRVFHLVTQEELQKGNASVGSDSNQAMAFAFKGDKHNGSKPDNQASKGHPPRRNRPFCSHCNMLGHTIERCYKIHGYPPGYHKPNKTPEATANQIQTNDSANIPSADNHTILPQLTTSQYQQLLNLLGTQQTGMHAGEPSTSMVNSGQTQQEDNWKG